MQLVNSLLNEDCGDLTQVLLLKLQGWAMPPSNWAVEIRQIPFKQVFFRFLAVGGSQTTVVPIRRKLATRFAHVVCLRFRKYTLSFPYLETSTAQVVVLQHS